MSVCSLSVLCVFEHMGICVCIVHVCKALWSSSPGASFLLIGGGRVAPLATARMAPGAPSWGPSSLIRGGGAWHPPQAYNGPREPIPGAELFISGRVDTWPHYPGQLWPPGPHPRGPVFHLWGGGMQHPSPGRSRPQGPHPLGPF